jgi:hypothetical protein
METPVVEKDGERAGTAKTRMGHELLATIRCHL